MAKSIDDIIRERGSQSNTMGYTQMKPGTVSERSFKSIDDIINERKAKAPKQRETQASVVGQTSTLSAPPPIQSRISRPTTDDNSTDSLQRFKEEARQARRLHEEKSLAAEALEKYLAGGNAIGNFNMQKANAPEVVAAPKSDTEKTATSGAASSAARKSFYEKINTDGPELDDVFLRGEALREYAEKNMPGAKQNEVANVREKAHNTPQSTPAPAATSAPSAVSDNYNDIYKERVDQENAINAFDNEWSGKNLSVSREGKLDQIKKEKADKTEQLNQEVEALVESGELGDWFAVDSYIAEHMASRLKEIDQWEAEQIAKVENEHATALGSHFSGKNEANQYSTKKDIDIATRKAEAMLARLREQSDVASASINRTALAAYNMEIAQAEKALADLSYAKIPYASDYDKKASLGLARNDNKLNNYTGRLTLGSATDRDAEKITNRMQYTTAEEKKIYAYILETQGSSEADKYLDNLDNAIEERASTANAQRSTELAENSPVLASLATIAMRPGAALNTVAETLGAAVRNEYANPNAAGYRLQDSADVIRGTVQTNINSPFGRLMYGAGMSVGDNLFALSMGGLGVATLIPLEAGAATMSEAVKNGATPGEALILGGTAAATEYVIERIGFERLASIFSGPVNRPLLKEFITATLAEGFEEVPGEFVDAIVEQALRSSNSIQRDINQFVDEGVTAEDAKGLARQNFTKNVVEGAVSGMMAGGFMTGAAQIGNSVVSKYNSSVESNADAQSIEAATVGNDNAAIAQEQPSIDMSDRDPAVMYNEDATPAVEQAPDMRPPVENNPFTAEVQVAGAEIGTTASGLNSVGSAARVTLENGSTVALSDLTFGDPAMQLIYGTAAQFPTTAIANTFLGGYAATTMPADTYARGFTSIYFAAKTGIPLSVIQKDASRNANIGAAIPQDTIELAYEAAKAARVEDSKKAWGNYPVEATEGHAGVVKAYSGTINQQQQNAVVAMDAIGKELGVQMVVTNEKNGAKSGIYIPGDNAVYINLNAPEEGLMKVVSHELLHYLRSESDADYQQITDMVLEAIGSEVDLEESVQRKIERYAIEGIELTRDTALEEVIADALPELTSHPDVVNRIAQENPSLVSRMIEWINGVIEKIKTAFKGNKESEALARNLEAYESIRDAFYDALQSVNRTAKETQNAVTEAVNKSITDGETTSYGRMAEQALPEYGGVVVPVDTDTVLGESGVVNTYDPSSNKKFFGIEQAGSLYIYPNSSNLFDTGVKNLFDGFDSETGYSRVVQPAVAEKNADGQWKVAEKGKLVAVPDNVKYFIKPVEKGEIDTEQNIKDVAIMKPVAILQGGEFKKNEDGLINQATKYFESIGGAIENSIIGEVRLDRQGVKSSVAHGIGRLKSIAFAAVPDVIKSGKIISHEINWEGRGYDTYVVAAPIAIEGDEHFGEYYVAAVVERRVETQDYYLHEVVAQQKSDRTIKTTADASTKAETRRVGHSSLTMLLQKIQEVKAGLSQNVNDVKYSLSDIEESSYAEIAAENRSLRAAVKALQEQMTLSRGNRYSDTEIRSIARRFLKDFDSRYNLDTLSKNLRTLFDFIENAPDLNWNQMMEATTDLVKAVLMESRALNNDNYYEYADLRKKLQTTRISLSDTQKAEAGHVFGSYNDYRKSLFNSVKLTNDGIGLDSIWPELSEQYPHFFPADASEGEMPIILRDVANALKPHYENPYSMNLDEYSADAAMRLYSDYASAATEPPTFADRQQAKYDAAKERYKENLARMREQYKERAEREQAKLKERFANRDAARKETETRNKKINQIKRTTDSLAKKLMANTDKQHIPERFKAAVASALTAFERTTDTMTPIQLNNLYALATEYNALKEGEGGDFLYYDEEVYDMIAALPEIMKGKSIGQLTTQELEVVANIVTALNHTVVNADKLFIDGRAKTVSDAGMQTESVLMSRPEKLQGNKVQRFFRDIYMKGNLTITTVMDWFKGTAMFDAYEHLRDGASLQTRREQEAQDYVESMMEKYNWKKWDKKATTTIKTAAGRSVDMTVEEMMTVYATWKREQRVGTRHIEEGGIILPDSKEGKRMPVTMTAGDMNTLANALTAEQRAYVDDMVEFLSTTVGAWNNEASMMMSGYKKFYDTYYIPFVVENNFLRSSPGKSENVRIKSMGSSKAITEKANSPIDIVPFTKLWSESATQSTVYSSLAVPLMDMERVLNYRSRDGEASSVKAAINYAMTDNVNSYLTRFLSEMNGGMVVPAGNNFVDKITGRAKKVAVMLNPRVVVQQFSAGVRATAELSYKHYAQGVASGTARAKQAQAEMLKYSAVAQLKEFGGFDTNMSGAMYQRIKGGAMQKIDNVGGWAPQAADRFTWGQLWEGVKAEINETMPMLERGSEEYFAAVDKRFTEIIDRTQVVDSILHRSEWMRSNGLIKMWTAFKSEPTKQWNMLVMGAQKWKAGDHKGAMKYFSSVIAGAVYNTLLAALIDGLRDTDDDEKEEYIDENGIKRTRYVRRTYKDKYIDAVVGDVASAPLEAIPLVGDILSMMDGFSPSRLDMKAIEEIYDAVALIGDAVTAYNESEDPEKMQAAVDVIASEKGFKKLLSAFSYATGIPLSNLYRDGNAAVKAVDSYVNQDVKRAAVFDESLPLMVRFEAVKANYEIKTNKTTGVVTTPGVFYDLLEQAHRVGLTSEINAIQDYMISHGVKASTIETNLKNRARESEPLVKEGVEQLRANDIEGYTRSIDNLVANGYDRETAASMIQAEYKEQQKAAAGASEDEATTNKPKSIYTYDQLGYAILQGNKDDADKIIADMSATGTKDSTIKGQITSKLKPEYYNMWLAGDRAAMRELEKTLVRDYGYDRDSFDKWIDDTILTDLWDNIERGDATQANIIRSKAAGRLGAKKVFEKLTARYADMYYELLQYDEQAAQVLKANLMAMNVNEATIDRWGKARRK